MKAGPSTTKPYQGPTVSVIDWCCSIYRKLLQASGLQRTRRIWRALGL